MSKKANIQRNGAAGAGAGGQNLPFARSVRAGGFVFVSGQTAQVNGELIDGGIVAQTRQTIENLRAILAESGCDLSDVVKVQVWLDDPRDFWSFNGVFKEYFSAHPPARSTVASPMVIDAKIEMDVVAWVGEK